MAVEEVCQLFNDLRSDLVLMYGLRTILLNYVFELQTLKHQCESVMPDKVSQSCFYTHTLTLTLCIRLVTILGSQQSCKCGEPNG